MAYQKTKCGLCLMFDLRHVQRSFAQKVILGAYRSGFAWLLLFTEATDQTSIRAIVFIAQQFTFAKSFDLGGMTTLTVWPCS